MLAKALAISFMFMCIENISTAQTERPNIVFWLSDNHATSTLNAYDGRFANIIICPNLDSLSNNATVYKNAFCSNPSYTRFGYPFLTGLINHDQAKPDESVFLPKILNKKGYASILLGVWNWSSSPSIVGFEEWQILSDRELFFNPEFYDGRNHTKYEGHVTDVITDLALDWIKVRIASSKPFFVMLSMPGTQRPWMPPIRFLNQFDEEWLQPPETFVDDFKTKTPSNKYQTMNVHGDLCLSGDLFLTSEEESNASSEQAKILKKNFTVMNEEQISAWTLGWKAKNEAFFRESNEGESLASWKYQRFAKNYFRCLKAQDENIGRIAEFLNAGSNPSRTKLIYSAQRGRFLGEFGWFGCEWPYEQSLQIPLLVAQFPLKEGNFQKNKSLTMDINVYARMSSGMTLDQNLSTVVTFTHWRYPDKARVSPFRGIRTQDFKLIHYYPFDEWEYYDLKKDPGELENLFVSGKSSEDFSNEMRILEAQCVLHGIKNFQGSFTESWKRKQRNPLMKTR